MYGCRPTIVEMRKARLSYRRRHRSLFSRRQDTNIAESDDVLSLDEFRIVAQL